jgi:hypothetical protein
MPLLNVTEKNGPPFIELLDICSNDPTFNVQNRIPCFHLLLPQTEMYVSFTEINIYKFSLNYIPNK